MTKAPTFTAWLDDFFATYYRHHPVNATFIGVHDYDDQLPDFSQQGLAAYVADIETLLRRLATLPDEALTPMEALDRQLVKGFLEIQRWEQASSHFQCGNPSTYTGEAIFSVIALFLRPFAPLPQRIEAAIGRMEAIPILLAAGQTNVRQAPVAWTARAIRECVGALNFLNNGIDTLIQQHAITDVRLRRAADGASQAFHTFQQYLEQELQQHPSATVACGPEPFALLLRCGHFLAQDAAALEAHAQEQFTQCADYLTQHARDFNADTWQAAIAQLAELHPSVDHYYSHYSAIWAASRVTAEQHNLLTWPDYPIRYVPQPAWACTAAPYLYFLPYRAPATFDELPVIDYLVTPIEPDMPLETQRSLLRATNTSVIKLNHVVHHGGIGHHVQNWYAQRAASRVGQIAAVDCAARIAMFCGGTLAEGWACYATELMGEAGFLTPLEQYAEHYGRLRMAARTLVDIRLHHGRYTLAEAERFYREQVGMSDAAATAEAVKNSMFPATATMYLVGTDLIHMLRSELADAQGSSFNLHDFHNHLLSYGSVPITLISAMLRREAVQAADVAKGGTTSADLF